MIYSLRWLAAVLFTMGFAAAASAVPLSVDFGNSLGTGGGPGGTQAGFEAFEFAEGGGNPPHTLSFANDAAVDGTIEVTIGGYTHFRDYAAVTGGPFTGDSALLSDSVLRNANGTMTLTLSDLKPGEYDITTFHHGTQFGGGVWDLLLSDATGDDILIADDAVSSSGTAPLAITTLSFGFLSDGSPIEIDIIGGTGPNHAQLNGFVLTPVVVPEPTSIALWLMLSALGAIVFIRRRVQ